jgi:hypothetical protein
VRTRLASRMSTGELGPIVNCDVALSSGVAVPHPGGAQSRPRSMKRRGSPSAAARLRTRLWCREPDHPTIPESPAVERSERRRATVKSGSNVTSAPVWRGVSPAANRPEPLSAARCSGPSSREAGAVGEARSACCISTLIVASVQKVFAVMRVTLDNRSGAVHENYAAAQNPTAAGRRRTSSRRNKGPIGGTDSGRRRWRCGRESSA